MQLLFHSCKPANTSNLNRRCGKCEVIVLEFIAFTRLKEGNMFFFFRDFLVASDFLNKNAVIFIMSWVTFLISSSKVSYISVVMVLQGKDVTT